MRPFAASCQRQIRYFHSFLLVFPCFTGFWTDLYNFRSSFAAHSAICEQLEERLSRLLLVRDERPVE
jgi:hypothetical protein